MKKAIIILGITFGLVAALAGPIYPPLSSQDSAGPIYPPLSVQDSVGPIYPPL